jgi:hypothetical protein
MVVFSLFFMPLEASADLPSLACVGFFLMVPSNDLNELGIVDEICSNRALLIDGG